MNLDLSKIKKVFFIGIGGIGISALAKMALSLDIEVEGVNDEESGKTIDSLKELGIKVYTLKDLESLPSADLYVYSDAWLFRGPEIIQKAKNTGRPALSYFEALGQFAKKYKVIAISGTHGKTTTTAMIGEVLIGLGLDPTIVVGSFVKSFGSNFRKGGSDLLVVEADEFNKHFLNFDPEVTIITNIEADHFDTYKDLNEVEETFSKLIFKTKSAVICNPYKNNLEFLTKDFNGEVLNYMDFFEEVPELLIPGEHNRLNASCVLSLVSQLGLDISKAKDLLSKFSGTWRRLEKRGVTNEGVIIYDDYAHHPTEVKASLSALREIYPKGEKRLVVVFQPHMYNRTKALFNDFIDAFDNADDLILLPIYFAREAKDPEVSSEKLAQAISLHKSNVTGFEDFESAKEFIKKLNIKGSNDVFVTMGAGEAYKVADDLFEFK